MRTINLIAMALLLFVSCKEQKKTDQPVIHDSIPIDSTAARSELPVGLMEVLKAHGGIDRWNEMRNLCFEFEKDSGKEIHTVSLPERMVKIEGPDWSIGKDKEQLWLLQQKANAYKGDPRFYYDLMFYFYAMPFVLADDGIKYSEVKGAELDGKVYEGIKIGYDAGIGFSPQDEYILYYEPENFEMVWLAYTVTRGEDEKSDDWHYIKYDDWQEVNGIKVPEKISWYSVENNAPVKKRNSIVFKKVNLTATELEASVFAMPETATAVDQK